MNHLPEVATLVAEADPGNTDLVVAALLHDAIEDQKKTREEISELFGKDVAGLVQEEDRRQVASKAGAKATSDRDGYEKVARCEVIETGRQGVEFALGGA